MLLSNVIICIIILVLVVKFVYKIVFSRKVYLVDYACFKPKKYQQRTRDEVIKRAQMIGLHSTKEATQFFTKGLMGSGIGDSTYYPEAYLKDPPELSLAEDRREAETAIYTLVDELFAKTAVKPEDVGVLVVNCSAYVPVPSLSSMVISKYKLPDAVKSFNLSGMGCTASLVAICLANQLLQVYRETYAMIVSTEVIAANVYRGDDLSKIACNCVFRVGGAAILLSNKPSDRHTSKYKLLHTVCTNIASFDKLHRCVYQEDDKQNNMGFTITKDVLVAANKAIKENVMTLAHLILPLSEKLLFIWNHLLGNKSYVPNFARAVDHFFPHVGGKMVIDELEKYTKLDGEAPRMTLYRYGNTSSSSTWYEMAYVEAKGRMKKGNRVWQIAFGSGFKCNSVIWQALKNVDQEKNNPWADEIDDYPIKLERFGSSPIPFEDPK